MAYSRLAKQAPQAQQRAVFVQPLHVIARRGYAAAKKGAPPPAPAKGPGKGALRAAAFKKEGATKEVKKWKWPSPDLQIPLLADGSEDYNSREYKLKKLWYYGQRVNEEWDDEVQSRVPDMTYLADSVKVKMWRLHVSDPDKWSLDEIARRFEVSRVQAAACILLKQLDAEEELKHGPQDESLQEMLEEEFSDETEDRIEDEADYVPPEKDPHPGYRYLAVEGEVSEKNLLRYFRTPSVPLGTNHLPDVPPPELGLNEEAVRLTAPRVGPKEVAKRRKTAGLKDGEEGGRFFFISTRRNISNEERDILVMDIDQSFRTASWDERVKLLNYPTKPKGFKKMFDKLMASAYPEERPNQRREVWIQDYPWYKQLDTLVRIKQKQAPIPVEELPKVGKAQPRIPEDGTGGIPATKRIKYKQGFWSGARDNMVKTPTDFDSLNRQLRKNNPRVRLDTLVNDILSETKMKKQEEQRVQKLLQQSA